MLEKYRVEAYNGDAYGWQDVAGAWGESRDRTLAECIAVYDRLRKTGWTTRIVTGSTHLVVVALSSVGSGEVSSEK